MHRLTALMVLAALAAASTATQAADDIRTERVQFAPGATSATVATRITGYETVDYVLGARAGQYANISMATDNGANYFNIIAPGETDVAFFNGSMASGGNQYEGVLPATGDYRVRVYLMRSAARRGETANYRLEMIIGADSAAQSPPAPGTGTATQLPLLPGEYPVGPDEGGPRNWEVMAGTLNLRDRPSVSGRVLATYRRGTILSNLGCQPAGGRSWCDVQELGGGPRGFVAADYLRSPSKSTSMPVGPARRFPGC